MIVTGPFTNPVQSALTDRAHNHPMRRVSAPQTSQPAPKMIKTFSLSVLFFLTLGLMFAAYASVPAGL